jgi:hypothetical protein
MLIIIFGSKSRASALAEPFLYQVAVSRRQHVGCDVQREDYNLGIERSGRIAG